MNSTYIAHPHQTLRPLHITSLDQEPSEPKLGQGLDPGRFEPFDQNLSASRPAIVRRRRCIAC